VIAAIAAGLSLWRWHEADVAKKAASATEFQAESGRIAAQVDVATLKLQRDIGRSRAQVADLKAEVAERYAVSCEALVLTTKERALLALDTSAELDQRLRATQEDVKRRGARVKELEASLQQQQSTNERERTQAELAVARNDSLAAELAAARQESAALAERLLTAQVAATDLLTEQQECASELRTLQTRVGELIRVTPDPTGNPDPATRPSEPPPSTGG
jgi:chromosome segregation ATPase